MKVLVLGGSGLQGRVAVWDLARTPEVSEVVCADVNPAGLDSLGRFPGREKVRAEAFDASDRRALTVLLAQGFDVAIDLLPSSYLGSVGEAAVEAGCDLVNTMYGHQMPPGIHDRAVRRDVTIVPEAGLDPGIDLVLCAHGVSQLDEVHELHSYCGGIPEPPADGNALRYKISWSWEGVLKSYSRPAVIVRDGEVIRIEARDQHSPQWVGELDLPGFGRLEVIPNGDAEFYARLLGVAGTIRNTTRCTLRWPGHAAVWKPLVELGFVEDVPVPGLPGGISPRDFMVRHLGPRLQYGDGERDLVLMLVMVSGLRGGERVRLTYELADRRDLETGFLAMTRTVGFAASAVAQMVATGQIAAAGLLTAVRDIPQARFLDEIRRRGIQIRESVQRLQ
ncbi:MAG: saccharopine dehydrogenase C-terminal domain-containing protein [Bacillota bacterium]|nr:saccharopine dehydrogenase C-terminal domain-containing protein [Bacillota bacterium]